MSSPDPLNDPATPTVPEHVPSSVTRRVTRSQVSNRYVSLGGSPQKEPQFDQDDNFDLGLPMDSSEPDLIPIVDYGDRPSSRDTRRKLFPTSSPRPPSRHQTRATTTVVPLNDSFEDEISDPTNAPTTPRRRGRLRPSNGTPIPGTKRRAGTPIRRTPRRTRDTPSEEPSEARLQTTPTPKRRARTPREVQATPTPTPEPQPEPQTQVREGSVSEADSQVTPTPRRTRRAAKRPTEPSSELGSEPGRDIGSSRRLTRHRRQALAPEDLVELVSEVAENAVIEYAPPASDDGLDLVQAPSERSFAAQRSIAIDQNDAEPGSDIWMTTLSNQATPRPSTRSSTRNRMQSSSVTPRRSTRATKSPYKEPLPEPVVEAEPEPEPRTQPEAAVQAETTPEPTPEPESGPDSEPSIEQVAVKEPAEDPARDMEQDEEPEYDGGYGYLAPAESEVSSADEDPAPTTNRDMDTIAQGEDFSMIFMDSIPSMQHDMSHQAATYRELGDETNMIINNTLESLRQADEEEEEQVDDDIPDLVDHASPESDEQDSELPTPPSREREQARPASRVPVRLSPAREPTGRPSPAQPEPSSPNSVRRSPAQQLSRESPTQFPYSPRKAASSSPLRHRVLKSQAENSPIASASRRASGATPRPSARRSLLETDATDDSMAYEDSFSEIPQDVLAAATPRRAGTAFSLDPQEEVDMTELLDQVEDEVDQVEQEVQAELFDEVYNNGEQVIEQGEEDDDQIAEHYIEDQVIEDEPEEEEVVYDEEDMVETEYQSIEPMEENEAQDEVASEEAEAMVDDQVEEAEEQDEGDNEDQLASTASVARSESSRLPTPPEDVPYLAPAPSSPQRPNSLQRPRFQSNITSPLQSMNIAPSVQYYEMAEPSPANQQNQQHQSPSVERAASSATPVNQISSPAQEPQSLVQEHGQDKASRPLLSPILRAGRMLQSVTSDPPSPDDRDRQLGSPFRSSGSKDSGRGSREPRGKRWLSKSPTRPPNFSQSQLFSHRESPRRISPGSLSNSGSREATPRASATVPLVKITSPHQSTTSSVLQSPPSDGVMSWIMREGPISPKLRGDNTLRDAYAAAGSNRGTTPQPAAEEEVDEAASSAEGHSEVRDAVEAVVDNESQADDETDIWELEAQRTPRPARQQPFGSSTTPRTARRRRAIPSAWTKETTTNTPKPVQQEYTAPAVEPTVEYPKLPQLPEPDIEDTEEYSLLERRRRAEEAAKNESSAVKNSRFDLSAFFSSPVAAIPGILASKFFPGKTQAERPKPAEQPAPLPTSSLFPSVQKPTVPPAAPRDPPPTQRTKQVAFGTQRDASPDTPEQMTLPTVSQKQNFTPRPRQASQTFFQASSAAQSTAATPPRMQLSHADIRRWQQDMSSASEDSPDYERRFLRPLPPKNASPSKSIIRSPLKPRTPGRVVEFTSSVLSPMEQIQARQERRSSNASAHQYNSFLSQHQPDQNHEDKENQDSSDVSMSDAPPIPQPKTVPVPVSQTSWTRQHWLFLDWLIQQRRIRPFEAEYDRCAEKYLGKTVRSHGEAMTLERWHLDCVDAFKAEVGGWDEGVLAKRVFALILGEERRHDGSGEAGQPAVLFH